MSKNRKILKFEEFTVNESMGANTNSFNAQANDPTLSADASDRFSMNMKNSIFRLTSLIRTLIDTDGIQVGHNGDFSDIEKITELKILRMYKNDNLLLDIYISFVIDDREYWGVFTNYGSIRKTLFKSEVKYDPDYNKNFLMKLEGLILKALTRFFTPEKGMYKSATEVTVQDKYGVKHDIDKGKPIKVEDVVNDEDDSYIQLDVKTGRNTNETFFLKGIDYYFFNYWFGEYTVEDANA